MLTVMKMIRNMHAIDLRSCGIKLLRVMYTTRNIHLTDLLAVEIALQSRSQEE